MVLGFLIWNGGYSLLFKNVPGMSSVTARSTHTIVGAEDGNRGTGKACSLVAGRVCLSSGQPDSQGEGETRTN